MMKHSTPSVSVFSKDSYLIMPKQLIAIKDQVEAVGTPLKEWDISINYGIKTGFNEAFIISKEKKDELIAADPKSAEILKPILRGKDIKRYKAEFADLWLVAIFPTLNIHIDNYPAVKKYLETFLPKLKQTGEFFTNQGGQREKTRKKTSNQWFETQDQISYYRYFKKEKIIYPNMTSLLPFMFDNQGYLTNQKCFILTSNNYQISLRYLVALLNSKIFRFLYKNDFPELMGKTYELSKVFFEKISLPLVSETEANKYNILVKCIVFSHKNFTDKVHTFETILDALIFQLYFPTHMQEKQIDIAQFVENDLNQVLQNRDFEQLNDSEKEIIIKQLHSQWTHPDNEVRNRIKLFAVRSPDILKPILESQP